MTDQPQRSRAQVMRNDHRPVGALVRRLRLAAGLSMTDLGRRSTIPVATISRLEVGQLRPRRSLLSAIALGIDPDTQSEHVAELVAAAGGDAALAADGRWPDYRRRRITEGILRGDVPLPSKLARRIQLHQAADAAQRAADSLMPRALDDAETLHEMTMLLREATRLRELAGGTVELHLPGGRVLRAGQ
ncbi:MAG TPA: helix-turn-helix transcriptional regulator [Streptosporangiaceae bacterium]